MLALTSYFMHQIMSEAFFYIILSACEHIQKQPTLSQTHHMYILKPGAFSLDALNPYCADNSNDRAVRM